MNRDDIIRFGEQADEVADRKIRMRGEFHPEWHEVRDEAFAALVAAAEREANLQQIEIIVEAAVAVEREACIKFLKSVDLSGLAVTPGLQMYTAELIEGFIEAIRARGEA
jgi:hypothetical protein